MKKFTAQAVLLIIVIAAGIYLYSPKGGSKNIDIPFIPKPATTSNLQINSDTFKVEIADTTSKRNKGLGGRSTLGEKEGMLFIFENKDRRAFWMKGMLLPIDFVWISDNKIVDLTENIAPPTQGQSDASLPIYSPKEPIDKVLELNAGSIKKFDIKVGDSVNIK